MKEVFSILHSKRISGLGGVGDVEGHDAGVLKSNLGLWRCIRGKVVAVREYLGGESNAPKRRRV